MKIKREDMLLYAVTDRSWIGERTLLGQVKEALEGGVTCVQLREKQLDDKSFLSEALEIRELCRAYGVPFIVNDNVDIAVRCKADGIHVGQRDMEAGDVRSIVSKDMIIGVSAQTVEQAVAAEKAGADYLGVGAVFSTSTKADACEVTFQTLREICSAVSIPVVAIGGINKKNILRLSGSGADGVAVVSAIFAAEDIESECKILKKLSEEMVK